MRPQREVPWIVGMTELRLSPLETLETPLLYVNHPKGLTLAEVITTSIQWLDDCEIEGSAL
jgi:hypothetical protein